MVDNEVKKVFQYGTNGDGDPRTVTVASGTDIDKGTILAMTSSPRTATASSSIGQVYAGIAAADKDSTDTSVTLAAWQNGYYRMMCSGLCTIGHKLKTAGDNKVMEMNTADMSSSLQICVGVAQQTGTNENIEVRSTRI